MEKSTIFLILSVFLMVQLIHARPGPRGKIVQQMFEDAVRERLPLKNVNAQNELVKKQMVEITKVLNESISSASDIFKKVIKDAKESEFSSQATNFTLFIDSLERLYQTPENEQITRIYEEFEELNHIMDKYNVDMGAHPSEVDTYFKRLLDQHEIGTIQKMFCQRSLKLVKVFDESIQSYITSLTPEQKQIESEFIAWFQKTTGDTNYNPIQWFKTLIARIGTWLVPGTQH